MTFLNPLLLFGLAAAALPLLIHLLNLRRLNTIEFSSLRFLKELQHTRIRRLKIRQILLLIIRTLVIVCLVLAFSRPALEGNLAGAIGTTARTTMVILLDDSPSMTVRTELGVIFSQAVRAAGEIAALARSGDALHILPLSGIRHSASLPSPVSPENVEELLANVSPSFDSVPLKEAAGLISGVLAESPNINREIYIVSDAQASQFRSQPKDSTTLFPEGVRVFLVPIPGPPAPGNLGVSSALADAQVISPSRPVEYDVVVRNGGETPAANSVVSVYLEGERTAQQSVTLPPGETGSYAFSLVPKKAGIIKGTIELEEDALLADNKRYFFINVPSQIRVALVGTADNTRFLQLALTAVQSVSGEAFFSVSRVDEATLGSVDLGSFDILLLSNIRDLSSLEAQRLVRFVTGGGGIGLFLGPETDPGSISNSLLKELGIPAVTGPAPEEHSPNVGSYTFSKIDFAHPVLSGLFEERAGGQKTLKEIESPLIHTRVQLIAGSRGNTIIGLSDGSPFLVEYTAGSGRMLLFSVDPSLTWSDFPLKGIFAPLVHRSSVYLSTGQEEQTASIVGTPVRITLRQRGGTASSYVIRTPDDVRERVTATLNPVTGMMTFVSPPTRTPGVYELYDDQGESLLGVAAVNVDPAESILRPADGEEIRKFFTALGVSEANVSVVPDPDQVTRIVTESRFGIELWRFMVAASIVLALLEMAIARVGTRKGTTTPGEA